MSQVSQASAPGARKIQGESFARARQARRVSVSEGYRLWAQTYDSDPNPLLALEERMIEPLLPKLTRKTVVDLACGTGRWLAKLLSRGAFGVGIDFSGEMLEHALRKPGLAGRIVKGDCLSLPLRDSSADLVMCSFALGHFADLRVFAGELGRIARRDSEVFLADLHPHGHEIGWRCGFRHAGIAHEIAILSRPIDEFRHVFESEGFELVHQLEPFLGKDEKPIFKRAGKANLFESLCNTPAIFVCHFKRCLRQSERFSPKRPLA